MPHPDLAAEQAYVDHAYCVSTGCARRSSAPRARVAEDELATEALREGRPRTRQRAERDVPAAQGFILKRVLYA